jgi:hypothetical protein
MAKYLPNVGFTDLFGVSRHSIVLELIISPSSRSLAQLLNVYIVYVLISQPMSTNMMPVTNFPPICLKYYLFPNLQT